MSIDSKKLEGNTKDLAISAVGAIPVAGQFLALFTAGLSFANKKHKLCETLRLSELFKNLDHISLVSCNFARMLTLANEDIIEKQIEIEYAGIRKVIGFFHFVKEELQKKWKGLSTPDKTGVSYTPQDKRAVLDLAALLQLILSKTVLINKNENLEAQFFKALTGKTYQPRVFTTSNTIATTQDVQSVASAVASASTKHDNLDIDSLLKRLDTQQEICAQKEEDLARKEREFQARERKETEQEVLLKEHVLKLQMMEQRFNEEIARRDRKEAEFKRKIEEMNNTSVGEGGQVQAKARPNTGKHSNDDCTLYTLHQRLERLAATVEIYEAREGIQHGKAIKTIPEVESPENQEDRRKLFEGYS